MFTKKKVNALMAADLVERNALLKIKVQRAEIQKGAFLAQKGIDLAKAALNVYMHRDIHDPLEPVLDGLEDLTSLNEQTPLEDAQTQAIFDRPELQSARLMLDAAYFGKHVATADMLPELNAISVMSSPTAWELCSHATNISGDWSWSGTSGSGARRITS